MKLTDEPRPARLVAVKLPAIIDGIGRGSTVVTADPQTFHGWTFSIRGGAVFLVSPRGWVRTLDNQAPLWNKEGPRQIFEIPRTECRLIWEADDMAAIDKAMQRYDTPVLCRPGQTGATAAPVARDAKEMGDA